MTLNIEAAIQWNRLDLNPIADLRQDFKIDTQRHFSSTLTECEDLEKLSFSRCTELMKRFAVLIAAKVDSFHTLKK